MAVRNFWIDGDVDGRTTSVKGGPVSKTGGMQVDIKQRDDGKIITAVKVRCSADDEGNLVTNVYDNEDVLLTQIKTKR